jgi:hypothetical protein
LQEDRNSKQKLQTTCGMKSQVKHWNETTLQTRNKSRKKEQNQSETPKS